MCTPTTLSLGKDTIGNFQSSYSANTNLEIQAPLTSSTCEACDFCIWIMLSLKPVLIANCFVMPLALLRSNTNLCQIQCFSHFIFVCMLSLEPNMNLYWIRLCGGALPETSFTGSLYRSVHTIHTNRTMIICRARARCPARWRPQNMTSRHNHSSRHNLHPAGPIRIPLTVWYQDSRPRSAVWIAVQWVTYQFLFTWNPVALNLSRLQMFQSRTPHCHHLHHWSKTMMHKTAPYHCRGCIR